MRGLGLMLWLVAGVSAAGAMAETVGVEGRGVAPIGAGSAPPPRARALEAALADAVRQVGEGLVGGAGSPAAEAALREALGPDLARFVTSYRSVSEEERVRSEGSGREVAIVVEAKVDRDRVAAALQRAGLLAEDGDMVAPGSPQRIVIEPVPSWATLTSLRRRLAELAGAPATLERVEAGRVVVAVAGGRSASSLAEAAVSSPPPGVAVVSLGSEGGVPRLRLEAAPAEAPPPIDTPSAKR